MPKSVVYFLATRLLFSRGQNYAIKTITWACFTAIVISTWALALVFAVMQGFESATACCLQSVHPQILMQAPTGQHLNWHKIASYLNQNPNINAATPYVIAFGVIHNPELSEVIDWHTISLIKGIAPESEGLVSQIPTKITPKLDLKELLKQNYVIIGDTLAKHLQLQIDQAAELFVPESTNPGAQSINFHKIPVQVCGTISTGIADLDESLILINWEFLQEQLENSGVSEIGIKSTTGVNLSSLMQELRQQFKLSVIDWQSLYGPVIAALRLEKYATLGISVLVVMMSIMTLIALLFMQITRYLKTIVTLWTIGFAITKIEQIFLLMSLMLTATACALGIGLATLTGQIIQKYNLIDLPDLYYITSFPIQFSVTTLFLIWLATITITFIAIQIPLRMIRQLNLTDLLKNQ